MIDETMHAFWIGVIVGVIVTLGVALGWLIWHDEPPKFDDHD